MVKHQLRHTIKIILVNNSAQYLADTVHQILLMFHGTTQDAGGFSSPEVPYTVGEGQWGQDAQGIVFSGIGNKTYSLTGGKDYGTDGVGFIKLRWVTFKPHMISSLMNQKKKLISSLWVLV